MFLSQGSENLPNAPLWFVPCLIIVEIIYYWLSKLKKLAIISVATTLTVLGWVIESNFISFPNEILPWSLDSAFFAIGFFTIGNLTFKKICTIEKKLTNTTNKKLLCIAISIFAITTLVPLALHNGKISMGSKILGNGFILYSTGILGVCFILPLSILLKNNKLFKYCGKNSFQIMAVHYLFRDSLRLFFKLFNIPIYDKTIWYETILPIAIVFFASVLFSLFYNKIKMLINQRLCN